MKKIASFILFSLSASLQALVIGTNAEFPPYTFVEEGKIVGFDIEVAQEVAKRLNETVTWKDVPFDALIPDLVLGRVDFLAAGLSINEERSKRVLFTKSYVSDDPLVIFSLNKALKSMEDLKGKSIVVVEGFNADCLISSIEGLSVVRLPTQTDAFMSIKAQRADAFITAASTVRSFVEAQKGIEYVATPIPGTSETCALAFSMQSQELHAKVQAILDGMEADGTLALMLQKWKLQ
jgi:ABC-type amino acid transport substrate-binding protein